MEDFDTIQLFSPGTCEALDSLHEDDITDLLHSLSFDMDAVLQHMSSNDAIAPSTAAQPPDSGETEAMPVLEVVTLESSQPTPTPPSSPPPSPSRAELVQRARNLPATLAERAEENETAAQRRRNVEALRDDPTRQLTAAEIEVFAIFHAPSDLTQKEWDRLTVTTPAHQLDYLRRFKCSSEKPPAESQRPFIKERVEDPEWYPRPFIFNGRFYCWWCRHKTVRGDHHGLCCRCFARFAPNKRCTTTKPCKVCETMTITARAQRDESIKKAKGNENAWINAKKERLRASYTSQYVIVQTESAMLMKRIVHYFYTITRPKTPVKDYDYAPFYANPRMTVDVAYALQRELKLNRELEQPDGRDWEMPQWLDDYRRRRKAAKRHGEPRPVLDLYRIEGEEPSPQPKPLDPTAPIKPSPTKVINQLGIIGEVYAVNEGQRVLSPARRRLNLRPKATATESVAPREEPDASNDVIEVAPPAPPPRQLRQTTLTSMRRPAAPARPARSSATPATPAAPEKVAPRQQPPRTPKKRHAPAPAPATPKATPSKRAKLGTPAKPIVIDSTQDSSLMTLAKAASSQRRTERMRKLERRCIGSAASPTCSVDRLSKRDDDEFRAKSPVVVVSNDTSYGDDPRDSCYTWYYKMTAELTQEVRRPGFPAIPPPAKPSRTTPLKRGRQANMVGSAKAVRPLEVDINTPPPAGVKVATDGMLTPPIQTSSRAASVVTSPAAFSVGARTPPRPTTQQQGADEEVQPAPSATTQQADDVLPSDGIVSITPVVQAGQPAQAEDQPNTGLDDQQQDRGDAEATAGDARSAADTEHESVTDAELLAAAHAAGDASATHASTAAHSPAPANVADDAAQATPVSTAAHTPTPGATADVTATDAHASTAADTPQPSCSTQQPSKPTYEAQATAQVLYQDVGAQRPLADFEVGRVRSQPLQPEGSTYAEELMRARLAEHTRLLTSLIGTEHFNTNTMTSCWAPSTCLGLRPADYSSQHPGMSDAAAELPDEEKWGHKLHGVFTGEETVEVQGDRMRYIEELMRALFKTMTSMQAACCRLLSDIHCVADHTLRHKMLTETMPAIIFPVTDATALAVEALFSHIHVRRQNLLRVARAAAHDCLLALSEEMLNQPHLF